MKIIESRQVLKTPVFRVTRDIAHDPEGFEIRRAIVRHAGSAVMMAVDEKKRVLLVRQYRLPAQDYLWELPAGRLDPGESPLRAARRELKEETGLKARKWKQLASYYASPGFVEERMTIYLAQDLTEGEQQLMHDERITTKWFTSAEIDGMIRRGEILDGKTLIGFLMWQQYHALGSAKLRGD